MLNARLYRVSLVPFLLALAIAAFSLQGRPAPLTTTLAPDAFQGAQALAELRSLAAAFPERRPGSAADDRLAAQIAQTFEGLGGTADGGFSVRVEHTDGQTIDGSRRLSLVIAERPGSVVAAPIVIVAHRDAAARTSAGELSATAVLVELARVFASRQTKRPIVLVSTSGGSGGDAGAMALASALHGPVAAAIVIGDVAAGRARRPMVIPFSDAFGSASLVLARTVAGAILQQTGSDPGAPSTLGQIAHLAFPLAPGEQGVLNAAGIPAVMVQASGERGPASAEPISGERLEGLGRAVLSSVDALDAAPDISSSAENGVVLQRKILPGWAVSLLVLTALLGPLVAVGDGLARARRRRLAVGRGTLWVLSCSLPFISCALLAYLLGALGILGATPPIPALPEAMPFDAAAATATVAMVLTFALSWLLWVALVRRLGWGARPDGEVTGLAVLIVLLPVALIVWGGDAYTALLLLPATHLWLLLASPEIRPRRAGSLALVALGLAPLALLIAFYADQLGLGAGGAAWMAVMLLAGGHVGVLAAMLWSLALGSAAAAAIVALASPAEEPTSPASGAGRVTIRGPLTYAGPGSLGGTESALRR